MYSIQLKINIFSSNPYTSEIIYHCVLEMSQGWVQAVALVHVWANIAQDELLSSSRVRHLQKESYQISKVRTQRSIVHGNIPARGIEKEERFGNVPSRNIGFQCPPLIMSSWPGERV